MSDDVPDPEHPLYERWQAATPEQRREAPWLVRDGAEALPEAHPAAGAEAERERIVALIWDEASRWQPDSQVYARRLVALSGARQGCPSRIEGRPVREAAATCLPQRPAFCAYHLADIEGNDGGAEWLASNLLADELRGLLRPEVVPDADAR